MLTISLVNQLLGLATIFAQTGTVLIALALIFRKSNFGKLILNIISPKALFLAFLVSLSGVVGSLYYSDFIGFEPCTLCWWQRVFMYPQTIILGTEMIRKNYYVLNYCILFSAIGAFIAFYQSLLMFGIAPNISCTALGVSCSQIFVLQYGYITIPLMALTAFLLIIVLLFAAKFKSKK